MDHLPMRHIRHCLVLYNSKGDLFYTRLDSVCNNDQKAATPIELVFPRWIVIRILAPQQQYLTSLTIFSENRNYS